jgi:PPK2 family polyphosphate:nucleotide phosphotransferase
MTIDPQLLTYLEQFRIKEGKEVSLKKFDTDYDHKLVNKEQGEQFLKYGIEQMAQLQDKLYAENKFSVLIVIQAMDAAGKDGIIKHVMSGLNPQGVKVTSFKVPTALELKHDFLWRHSLALPAKGEIGIFNRSQYENVLVTRVHPEYILAEGLPGIDSVQKIDQSFWNNRFRQINEFENTLVENGTIILKFFLHLSKKEQKKRFLERIDNPAKNWKFSTADVRERGYWKEYRKAYEDLLEHTSKENAPWFVIPADDKWFTRLVVAGIICRQFEKLHLEYPVIGEEQKLELEKARQGLVGEKTKESTEPGEDGE